MENDTRLKRIILVSAIFFMLILFYTIPINEQELVRTSKNLMDSWLEYSIKSSVIYLLLGVLFEILFLYPYNRLRFKINIKLIPALFLIIIGLIPNVYWGFLLMKLPPAFKWVISPLSISKTQAVINLVTGILLAKSFINQKQESQV